MSPKLCANDGGLYPIANCRPFDFTFAFESYVLSLVPSAITLCLSLGVLARLRKKKLELPAWRHASRRARTLYAVKMGSVALFTACNVVVLAGWVKEEVSLARMPGVVAASVLVVTSLAMALVTHFEHFRTTRPSILLPFYLLSTILCDAARLRTLATTGFSTSLVFRALIASYVARVVYFITENSQKGWAIQERGGVNAMSPEATASFVSRVFFAWATPLLIRGARMQLTMGNLDPISEDLDALRLWDEGKVVWDKEKAKGGKHPLVWTLVKAFPSAIFAPIFPCVVYSLAFATIPQIINEIITFIGSYKNGPGQPVENGWGLCAAIFLIYATYGVAYSWFFLQVNRASAMLRGFLIEAIYRKALTMHVEAARSTGSGKTGSMMSLETEKIVFRLYNCYNPISALTIVFIGLILLYQQIGAAFVSTILGIAFIFAIIPLLSRGIGAAQLAWSTGTDARQKLTNSVIKNFLPVKLSALDEPLKRLIEVLRAKELAAYAHYWISMCKMSPFLEDMYSVVNILNLFTLGTYSIVTIINIHAPQLDTARMFTIIAVIATLTAPLNDLGQGWASLVAAWTSIHRIQSFLLEADKPSTAASSESESVTQSESIVFSGASFGHGQATFLHDVSTVLPEHKVSLIIGRVGCGKSTLLQACLGEVDLLKGSASIVPVRTAFCSQDPWLRTETIRSAILFCSEYEHEWYTTVIRALTLDIDFKTLTEGDQSMTSQLSGGQRQRVALARAVYARCDRVILDDCFSALDANTEDAVFTALFDLTTGLLRGKTVILATNGVNRLSSADHVVVLSEGRIAEHGSYDELLALGGLAADLVRDYSSERGSAAVKVNKTADSESDDDNLASDKALDDEGSRGGVGWGVYKRYGKAVGIWRVLGFFLCVVTTSASPVAIQIYQSYWGSSIGEDPRGGLRRFFGGYVALEALNFVAFGLLLYYGGIQAGIPGSAAIHRATLNSVMATSPATILKTGVGKVMNRFSSDIFLLDFGLPLAVLNAASVGGMALGSIIVISVSAPWISLVIAVISAFFVIIVRFYGRTSQQLRRLDLGSKTPLYSLLTDTIDADGLRTIRAFGAQETFRIINTSTLQNSQKPYHLMNVSRRWLNSTVNFCLAIINFGLVAFAIQTRHSTSAGLLAVALVQATQLTDTLNHLLISWVELEISVVAIERLKEMIELPAEEDIQLLEERDEKGLKEVWPRRGGIRFDNVTARYGPDGEAVLKGLTFDIRAGSRVGIVGRTGSGKSTTLTALFRLIEPDAGGRILVDGKDISEISLTTLRSAMTLIPQEPLLLEMSIRDNLDVTRQARDDEIWAALDKASLKSVIEALPGKLDEVITGSSGFSRGQKQLLALARALIQNRAIVCLDEATSSIDVETDAAVQRTLRSSFGAATIITIAHRIATIQDYDSIIVLDNGHLAEHGRPEDLLKIKGGLFRKLVKGEEGEEAKAQEAVQEAVEEIVELARRDS